MNHERILVHKSPENSVFGLKGSDVTTDEEKFYIKTENDTRNSGWKEIPPTPTPTQTVSVTPSKTMIVTRTPYATYVPPTPTPTISITPTITPSSSPGTSTTPTPTPTETPFRTTVNYTVISNNVAFGTAEVIGAPSTGIISVGDQLILKATINTGSYFQGWSVPESVSISSSIYQLNPVIQLVSLGGGNVTITGSFASGSLPTYYADGSADSFGVLDFYYIVWSGERVRYYNNSLRPGQTVSRAVCANRIFSTTRGTVTLTSISC